MTSDTAPDLVSVSISSLSHHPSPAPSSSPPPESPTPQTSAQSPRKRKRDELLVAPEPQIISSPPSLFSERTIPASRTMSAIELFSSIWGALKVFAGIGEPVQPVVEVEDIPDAPTKRPRVDSAAPEEGQASGDLPNKEESILTQIPNKDMARSQTNNTRGTLKIKAPDSIAKQTPPTQQLPSPLASSSEDEGESQVKKTTTTRPVRTLPAKMGPTSSIFRKPSVLNDPLEQAERPFFAQPLQRKRDARIMLQRALARREAHSDSGIQPPRFPIHLQRNAVYRTTGSPRSRLGRELYFTPGKSGPPQEIMDSFRRRERYNSEQTLAHVMTERARLLTSHKGRVRKIVRENYARSQARSQAESESLDALLKQLIADKAQGFQSFEEVSRRRKERAEDVERMRKADTKVEKIPPLTREQSTLYKATALEIKKDLTRKHQKVYIEKFRIPVGTSDLHRTSPGQWLNDELINFYMNMIVARSIASYPGEPQRAMAHNTFFYPKLEADGYKGVSRWAKRLKVSGKELLNLHYLFVPVHVGSNHWCLAVANFRMRRIEYYDSLGGNFQPKHKSKYYDRLRDYVEQETGTSLADWTYYSMDGAPQQSNSSDCGVFTVKTAETIARGGRITFGAEDMPLVRQRIMLEILAGDLMPWTET